MVLYGQEMDKAVLPAHPPARAGLIWRGLERSDLAEWFSLVQRIQEFDQERERTTWDVHSQMADRPYVDLARDCLAAVDGEGVLRAVGRNAFRPDAVDTVMVNLVGGVDPEWREQGLGRELLSWQISRAQQNIEHLRTAPDAGALPALIGRFVEDHVAGILRLFEAAGFAPSRWFDEMRRDLDVTLSRPHVDLPERLEIVAFGPDVSERVRLAHNEAFRDHWGSNLASPEDWDAQCVSEAFRPAMSLAVIDSAQKGAPVVGYVLNYEHEGDWESLGYSEGYTDLLGVRRQWRGHGLASELLQRSAELFAEAGHPYATLHVDFDNSTGAGALYHSLGYRRMHRTTYWSKPVQ